MRRPTPEVARRITVVVLWGQAAVGALLAGSYTPAIARYSYLLFPTVVTAMVAVACAAAAYGLGRRARWGLALAAVTQAVLWIGKVGELTLPNPLPWIVPAAMLWLLGLQAPEDDRRPSPVLVVVGMLAMVVLPFATYAFAHSTILGEAGSFDKLGQALGIVFGVPAAVTLGLVAVRIGRLDPPWPRRLFLSMGIIGTIMMVVAAVALQNAVSDRGAREDARAATRILEQEFESDLSTAKGE